MDSRLHKTWASTSGPSTAPPMMPPHAVSLSRSQSSGSEASDGSSHSGLEGLVKTEMVGGGFTQPFASAAPRSNAAASGSGNGTARSKPAVGPGKAVDKPKAAQPMLVRAAGGDGQGPSKVKRKRDGDGKRKKVAKACLVCQRSHLTCDEKRPCTRCVKKGIADQCVEGVRKKAKYLMEGETEEPPDSYQYHAQPTPSISPAASSSHRPDQQQNYALPLPSPPSVPPPTAAPRTNSHLQTLAPPTLAGMGMEEDIWLAPQLMASAPRADSPGHAGEGVDVGAGAGSDGGEGLWGDAGMSMFGNAEFDFGTSASNEYQMLDAMLNSMSPVFPFDIPANNALSFDTLQPPAAQPHNPYLSNPSSGMSMLTGQPNLPRSYSNPDQSYAPTSQRPLISPNWPTPSLQSGSRAGPSQNMSLNSGSASSLPGSSQMAQPAWTGWMDQSSGAEERGQVPGSAVEGKHEQGEMNVWGGAQPGGPKQVRMKTAADVYHSVVKPFDYTEGYHRLMEHISRNYQQKEVLRVVKALAVFRPSLIALQMPMSEEDEIFVERSFQRTLIELEKLVSYSATPTAVWRRTGELVYANPEFCGLIGKQQDELLTGRTYVYQLFAKQSAISYWENFSVHAFENTTQNFFQATTLEVGTSKLATSGCYTIRRDVFDLPSVIIGQFLPIPTDL